MPNLGDVVEGYELLGMLAEGGMATVYLARDLKTDTRVALKALGAGRHDHRLFTYFQREAAMLASLDHPGIVKMLDVHVNAAWPFIIEELLVGRTLRTLLDEAQRIPWRTAAEIALQLSDALHHAHCRGVVHRDIKPENVFLVGMVAKLIDFGIAREFSSRTATRLPFGSPAYIAPEVLHDATPDPRTDLFSFGVVLFEMIEGRSPWQRVSVAATMAAVLNDPLPAITADCPLLMKQLLATLMAKPREQRTISAAEVTLALASILELNGVTALPQSSMRDTPERDPSFARQPIEKFIRTTVARDAYSRATVEGWRTAVDEASRAIEIDPDLAEPYAIRASALQEMYYFGIGASSETLAHAYEDVTTALRLDPTSGSAALSLVKLHWNTGRAGEALSVASNVLRSKPDDRDAILAFSVACTFAGIAERGIPHLESLLTRSRTDVEARYRLGEALQGSGDYERSTEVLSEYSRMYPWIGGAYEISAMNALSLGDPVLAKEFLDRHTKFAGPPNALFHGEVLTALGDHRAATGAWMRGVEEYEKSLKQHPRPRGDVWLAMLCARLGWKREATAAMERASGAEPQNGYILFRVACIQSMLGDFEEAVNSLHASVDAGFRNWQLLRAEEGCYFRDIAGYGPYETIMGEMTLLSRAAAG